MRVRVLFFAGLREAVGSKERVVEVGDGASLGDLLGNLESEHPPVAQYSGRLVISLNERRQPLDTPLAEGDEIALLPPMSGGAK